MNLTEEMLKHVVFGAAVLTPVIRLYLYQSEEQLSYSEVLTQPH